MAHKKKACLKVVPGSKKEEEVCLLTPLPHAFPVPYWWQFAPWRVSSAGHTVPSGGLPLAWLLRKPDPMLCPACFLHIWKWQEHWACGWLVLCRRQDQVGLSGLSVRHQGGCVNQAAGCSKGIRGDAKGLCPTQGRAETRQDFAPMQSKFKRDRGKKAYLGGGEILGRPSQVGDICIEP